MSYDDTPYWAQFHEPTQATKPAPKPENSLPARPSEPWSSQVLLNSQNRPRAPEPSPLLKEYMDKQGIKY